MDLIYMDKNKIEIGVLLNYNFDMDIGVDNDFEIVVGKFNHKLRQDYMFYIENTEYGGIVDIIKSDTRASKIYYQGRSFRGILDSKIISPLPGDSYYVVSGDANIIIANMLNYVGLNHLFKAGENLSGINISNYSFNRYASLLSGLNAMLKTKNARLKIRYTDGYVEISAEEIEDKSDLIEFSADTKIQFIAEDKQNQVNHLICLGQGELADRQVIHLYVDGNGNIGNTQYYTGIDEVVAVYNDSSAESLEELRKGGVKRLRELMDSKSIDANVENMELELGDIISGREEVTGISIDRPITQKIVRINNNIVKIEYKVGD